MTLQIKQRLLPSGKQKAVANSKDTASKSAISLPFFKLFNVSCNWSFTPSFGTSVHFPTYRTLSVGLKQAANLPQSNMYTYEFHRGHNSTATANSLTHRRPPTLVSASVLAEHGLSRPVCVGSQGYSHPLCHSVRFRGF